MKKIFWAIVLSCSFSSSAIAQTDMYGLSNSLYGLWTNGKTTEAVNNSVELHRLNPPMFVNTVHSTLSQLLMRRTNTNGQIFLDSLMRRQNEQVNQIVYPIYLWGRALNVTQKDGANLILNALNRTFKDSSNYQPKTELYSLLILQDLERKNLIDKTQMVQILQKNIQNLESSPYVKQVIPGRVNEEKRAWNRYLLAYSYHSLFAIEKNEDQLKKAAAYSPDQQDRQYAHSYFYDGALLTGQVNTFGFQSEYLSYLTENKRNDEALELLCQMTFSEPTDVNLTALKSGYKKADKSLPFKSYWANYVHQMGKPVPKVKVAFAGEVLDLTVKPNRWIYIDVWGTWCSPCVKELPELQAFYVENQKVSMSNLKIVTFSYSSQNLADFLQKNQYTFPVSEIDDQIKNQFGINSFPTKILISPEGNYIVIPFGVDWKMYVKNYIQN